jgi:hypothetical protein
LSEILKHCSRSCRKEKIKLKGTPAPLVDIGQQLSKFLAIMKKAIRRFLSDGPSPEPWAEPLPGIQAYTPQPDGAR